MLADLLDAAPRRRHAVRGIDVAVAVNGLLAT
jgi:hypothetical protein